MLAVFDRLGQDSATAMGYARLLDGYVTGQALQRIEEQKMWQHNDFSDVEDVRQQARSWWAERDGTPAPYPLLGQARRNFFAANTTVPDENTLFTLGLECLLDGIAARLS